MIENYGVLLVNALRGADKIAAFNAVHPKFFPSFARTIEAIHMKYKFNDGKDTCGMAETGLPEYDNMNRQSNDVKEAASLKEVDYRPAMVDSIAAGIFPTDLRIKAGRQEYLKFLIANKGNLLADMERVQYSNDGENLSDNLSGVSIKGDKPLHLHWAVYDIVKNMPIVYNVTLDVSALKKNADAAINALSNYCVSQSSTTYKLSTIAELMDSQNENIRVTGVNRLFVGLFYHADNPNVFGDIFRVVTDGYILNVTHEILTSRGVETTKSWFTRKNRTLYNISDESMMMDRGTTETNVESVISYDTFQLIGVRIPGTKHIVSGDTIHSAV